MIQLDVSHTCHTRARTGIQRVTLSLLGELQAQGKARPITWDPHEVTWRPLDPWENNNLEAQTPGTSRGARWPLGAKVRGGLRRLTGTKRTLDAGKEAGCGADTAKGILVPELFSPAVAAALPRLRAEVGGPAVAIFHDAIALKRPAMFPRGTVARFPSYMTELARFDGVAAVSEASRQSLCEYWDWLGLKDRPPLVAIPLGTKPPVGPGVPAGAEVDGAAVPEVLCLCTIETRKNHTALIEACEALWAVGHEFSLHLAGMAKKTDAAPVLARVKELQSKGRRIRHSGAIDEIQLEQAYQDCTLSIYPSLEEGFGLPVIESLSRGRPCLCSGAGALGEISNGGGCLTLGALDAGNLAAALGHLLQTPQLMTQLRAEAKLRKFRTWTDYAQELTTWMGELRRH